MSRRMVLFHAITVLFVSVDASGQTAGSTARVVEANGRSTLVNEITALYVDPMWRGPTPTRKVPAIHVWVEEDGGKTRTIEVPFATIRRLVVEPPDRYGKVLRIEKRDGTILTIENDSGQVTVRDPENAVARTLKGASSWPLWVGVTRGRHISLDGFSGRTTTAGAQGQAFYIIWSDLGTIEFQ